MMAAQPRQSWSSCDLSGPTHRADQAAYTLTATVPQGSGVVD
ncbi:putative integrase domain protein [Mycobacterium ulcerans str. Harvey]|uniref:Integrase domain protein n=1 Tax=Mycobacterium ulcerans str. Harvey TaxID=1299332 RepID=A0ABP3ABC8_MYCUL|nr:putative integrase domain protein [Mycobacterium ulcerans str. Harvey]